MRATFVLSLGLLVMSGALPAEPSAPIATPVAPALLTGRWPAEWVTAPGAPMNEFGVFLFRKEIVLPDRPARFVVHVTADARYRFFVNGNPVCFGPQRSDTWVWRYETVDIARWLRSGPNVLAAQVWSYGETTPLAVVGLRTGFLLEGDSAAEQAANSGATWQVMRDPGYSLRAAPDLNTYLVVGPGFRLDAARHPWDWATAARQNQGWSEVRVLRHGTPTGYGTEIDHPLAPRNLPPMEETETRFATVRRAAGVEVTNGFVEGRAPVRVPAHARASLLLDHGVETNAFPRLVVGGGAGASVTLTYAEALVDAAGRKGNRNEVEGRHLVGLSDEFIADGAGRRSFTPPNFRTYRYVQVDVETRDQPLVLEDVLGTFTAYPFQQRGAFSSDDPLLEKIWQVGWRTARLCAFETYVDCPYYEQLQYVGDTRIQALISLYVSGDDRLMRNAIELFDRSRLAEGLTQSRYPCAVPQVINTFSLFWIEMVHDYWMHRSDAAFVEARLPGIEAVLGWFERRVDAETGLLGPLPYWTFVDWTDEWAWNPASEAGGAHTGGSSIVSLQLARTLDESAEMCRAFGRPDLAGRYGQLAARLRAAVVQRCWDESRRLFADTPARQSFSQHANALAVLAGAIDGPRATDLMRRVAADPKLIQCSTYFRFYLLRAMKRAGLGDEYLSQLGPWKTMLDLGLTTFAEKPDPTRSDCHAWSASPVYELLATVGGVEPASPGFASVRIEPHLGALRHVAGVVAHPRGEIKVSYDHDGDRLRATVSLPPGVAGTLVWRGESVALKPGEQTLELP